MTSQSYPHDHPAVNSKIVKLGNITMSWTEARNDENNGLHGKNNVYFRIILGRVRACRLGAR